MSKNNKRSHFNSKSKLRSLFGIKEKEEKSLLQEEAMQTPMRTIITNFFSKKLAVLGVCMFVFIFASCFILPLIFPSDITGQDPSQQNIPPGLSMMNVPQKLKANAKQLESGATFGAGIDNNGGVYLWGQLNKKLKTLPKGMGKIAKISCGLDHVLALSEDGKLYTWGNDQFNLSKIPDKAQKANIVYIEAGYQISAALDSEGNMYVWGNENIISISTKNVQGNIKQFVLNTTTALAITKDNDVVCLTSKETSFRAIPDEIHGNVIDIASTDKSAAALLTDGRVVVWGSGDFDIKNVPQEIQGRVKDIDAGRTHFTVLLDDGTVQSWGANNHNQASAPKISNVVSLSTNFYQNYAIDANGKVSTWGLKGYLMGSDQFGRDVFTRVLLGGQISLTIGTISVIISAIIGILIGGLSGYYGGKIDIILMRFGEIVNAIPFMPLAIMLSAIVGSRIPETGRIAMIMVILGVLSWTGLANLTRSQILSVRESEYVTAAKAMGIREISIIFKHILPNIISVLLVNLTLSLASCMLIEASLSFLGFGVAEPSPTWGNMLFSCINSNVIGNLWWRWVFPALALGMSTISINLIGTNLHEAIDPKSNDR